MKKNQPTTQPVGIVHHHPTHLPIQWDLIAQPRSAGGCVVARSHMVTALQLVCHGGGGGGGGASGGTGWQVTRNCVNFSCSGLAKPCTYVALAVWSLMTSSQTMFGAPRPAQATVPSGGGVHSQCTSAVCRPAGIKWLIIKSRAPECCNC